jgi:hypothetical protein
VGVCAYDFLDQPDNLLGHFSAVGTGGRLLVLPLDRLAGTA